jgi:hypothetical protein
MLTSAAADEHGTHHILRENLVRFHMRWTLAFSLVAALLGIALGVGLTWAELGPYARSPLQLVIDESKPLARAEVVGGGTYDFGVMEQDEQGKHTFEIRNTGNAPLKLAKGATTCKCTLSKLEDDTVQPGKSAKVELEWTASGHESKFHHSATIRTSDPHRQYIQLTIEGRVSRSHKIVPVDLRLTSISVGEGITKELLLYGYEAPSLKIKRHEFTDSALAKYFELKTREMPAGQVAEEEHAKAGKILELTVKPGLPLGSFAQRIRLWLDLPGDPMVEVPIEGTVIGDISIVGLRSGPASWHDEHNLLILRDVKRETGAQSRGMYLLVKGEHRDRLDLKVTSVRPDFLQVEFDKPQPVEGEEVVKIPFTIRIPPGSPVGEHSATIGNPGKIELDTGHPTTPRLQIYVTFAVEK